MPTDGGPALATEGAGEQGRISVIGASSDADASRSRQELEHEATHDALTGLSNRTLFHH